MSAARTCLECGHEGTDVSMRIVEFADPIAVTVMIPVSARQDAIEAPRTVPGIYGAEWRCRDGTACRTRAEALKPPAAEPRAAEAAPQGHARPTDAPDPAPADAPPSLEGGPDWLLS
jgi:hypothetical protein